MKKGPGLAHFFKKGIVAATNGKSWNVGSRLPVILKFMLSSFYKHSDWMLNFLTNQKAYKMSVA